MKIISRERYYIEGKKILTWPTKFKNHKTWDCVNKLSHIHMHKKNTNKLYLRFSKSYLAFFIFTLGTIFKTLIIDKLIMVNHKVKEFL